MLIDQGKAKYDYSEKQKSTLIENLKRKYKLTEMKDFGSISFVQTYFSRQIRNVSLQAIADACGKRL